MKKIEGIDLAECLKKAQANATEIKEKRIANTILDCITKRDAALLKYERLTADTKRAHEEAAKYEKLIARIGEGDWSVIPEAKEKKTDE